MKFWIAGFFNLLSRYKNIFHETWKIRHNTDTPERTKDESAFLPAHLELIETPVSIYPRLITYCIITFFIISAIISFFGKVEIFATANGKLTLSGRSKEIKPIENSIVKEIFVKDGDVVKKGSILLKLTTLGSESDTQRTESSLQQARLEQLRYKILDAAIEMNKLPDINFPETMGNSMTDSDKSRFLLLIKEQFSTWQNQKHQKELNIEKKRSERKVIIEHINRYDKLSQLERNRLNDFKLLLNKRAISRNEFLVQEDKYLEAHNQLRIYQAQLDQIDSEISLANEEYELVTKLFRNENLSKLQEVTDNIKILNVELKKNIERNNSSIITAPVSGKIQQLNVHTEGGVVTTAETLMIIVPENDILEVNAFVQNKDIGFIGIGQDVIIKVDAFPYTRYGYLTGKVKNINMDATENQQLGLVFNVVISIDKNSILSRYKNIHLTSGMAVTAEIKTGMRSVISYILSPLEETLQESLHER
ncbi:HlyD family type I secretion periplasmic adaptor subunit (plasmid) [Escherichia coli]|nr:HlyD family type I secretion periplasmic adaptor subunit [Escherichia coli]QMO33956.1 HlyD family type I secretion periplasmic adaptor subunit [Escherichia coli]QMO48671.1 HlyD family type I secretion periplasmic adaptor subunit [Escherichia coli]QMR13629.1 HlyD family type I secretion periplasmic adaptor subunit [Escherichia coli]WGB41214.1 HlyD family type I secretion periplasmic adaptor subunit [Escherichia coli]